MRNVTCCAEFFGLGHDEPPFGPEGPCDCTATVQGYPGSMRLPSGIPVNNYKEYNKNERTKGTGSDPAKP
jgi:hypothetical protein